LFSYCEEIARKPPLTPSIRRAAVERNRKETLLTCTNMCTSLNKTLKHINTMSHYIH